MSGSINFESANINAPIVTKKDQTDPNNAELARNTEDLVKTLDKPVSFPSSRRQPGSLLAEYTAYSHPPYRNTPQNNPEVPEQADVSAENRDYHKKRSATRRLREHPYVTTLRTMANGFQLSLHMAIPGKGRMFDGFNAAIDAIAKKDRHRKPVARLAFLETRVSGYLAKIEAIRPDEVRWELERLEIQDQSIEDQNWHQLDYK